MWTEILPVGGEYTRYEKTIEGGDQLRVETIDRRIVGHLGVMYSNGKEIQYANVTGSGRPLSFLVPRWSGERQFPWEPRFGEHFLELGEQVPSLARSLEHCLRLMQPASQIREIARGMRESL